MRDTRTGIIGRGPVTPKRGMIFFGVWIIIMLILMANCVLWYNELNSPEDWPSTVGTITDTDVRYEFSHGKGPHYNYHPEVNYSYSVNGETYQGDQISKSPKSYRTSVDAQQYIDNYKTGSQVTVFYDPENPSDAVLEDKVEGDLFIPLRVIALLTGIGVVGFIYWFWKWKA